MDLHPVDTLSVPGNPSRPNEDAYGIAGTLAWVIDGATGLADYECLDGPSDAAWLSATASATIAACVAAGETDPATLIAAAIDEAAARFARELVRPPEGRYQLPTASILLARFDVHGIDIAELGDCSLYARSADGTFIAIGGDAEGRAREREGARLMKAHGATLKTPEVQRRMREIRARRNTPDGSWLLGTEPEAAGHVRRHRIDFSEPYLALLATDGFASLVDGYSRYDAPELLEAAGRDGLESLVSELRTIERDDDPDCSDFPRFKQSDDATAVLVAIGAKATD